MSTTSRPPAAALTPPPRRVAAAAAKHAFLLAGAAAMLFPFYWMLTTSLKTFAEAGQFPPSLVPTSLRWENWAEAWNAPHVNWARAFANTVFIAAAVTAGQVVTAVLAAYAFARMRFRGRGALFSIFLATLFIPNEATLIPQFVLMSKSRSACFGLPCLGLYDTYAAQIVPFLASVFAIFLLRQFFLSVPRELQDAATIDGAGNLRFLWSVALPLARPALITVALVSFLASWNAFLWPLIVTSSPDIRPVQLVMNAFSSEFGTRYHLLMAAASFVILPMVAVYLVAQRYFIEGVARSGIRG
ncbi:MAG: carbohydrate ABC transporter permease [Candidatus Limnocylindria bacterium]